MPQPLPPQLELPEGDRFVLREIGQQMASMLAPFLPKESE